MSFQEKRIVASLLSFFLVFGSYFIWLTGASQAGPIDAPQLAMVVLVLILATVVLIVVITIFFSIVSAIAQGESRLSFVIDERDRLIGFRGLRLCACITGGGFMLAMVGMASGQSEFVVVNIIVVGFALGCVLGELYMLHIYRKGF